MKIVSDILMTEKFVETESFKEVCENIQNEDHKNNEIKFTKK